MAKRKPRVPEDADTERSGLSKEAWVAISTISAALITGLVTLIVHLYPATPPAANSAKTNPTPVTSTPSQTPLITADAIAGKWAGQARDSTGKSFQITLDIRKACAIGEKCGLISVSHGPCYCEVFLDKAESGEFEFRVDNFYGQSNRSACQAGGGEQFKLRPDDRLLYTTSYEPKAEGLLERKNN
jgi:hypothetical protein